MAIDPTTGIEQVTTPAVATSTTTPTATLPVYQAPTYTPGSNFSFDPNTYLPQVQQQANSIYDPQTAQLKALQQLGQTQEKQNEVTTNADFDKQLQAKIESINQRGAFFGGGAINQQNDVQTARTNALLVLQQQQQAADAQTQGQLGTLSAQEAQYVQDQLTGAKNSAYSMWSDAQKEYDYQQAQAEAKAEADRSYQLQLEQIKDQEKANKLSAKEAKKAKKQAQDNYNSDLAYKYAALAKGAKGSGSGGSANTNLY